MAEIPIPTGYGIPLVDLGTMRLPTPVMVAISAEPAPEIASLTIHFENGLI